MIKTNIGEVANDFAAWMLEQSKVARDIYAGLAAEVFMYVVQETPQYSGETVSNWRVSYGSPVTSRFSGFKEVYEHDRFRTPYTKVSGGLPNQAAVEVALAHMRVNLAKVSDLTQPIYISNATVWDGKGGHDVTDLEDPRPGWLRAINSPGRMFERGMAYNYSQNAGRLGLAKIAKLRSLPR